MRQGRADIDGAHDRKREPQANRVSPGAVSSIGIHPIRLESIEMFPGRGYESPISRPSTMPGKPGLGGEVFPKGSQGKR